MNFLAGQTKASVKQDLKYELYIDKENLKFFETLLKTGKYNAYLVKPIIKYYSNEIKTTINNMVELGRK